MTVKQKSEIKAVTQTLTVLSQNIAEVALLPHASPIITQASLNVQELGRIDTAIQGLQQFNAASKKVTRLKLAEKTFEVSSRCNAYALFTKDASLQQSLEITISTLNKMADITFRDFAQHIYNTVNPLVATLDPLYRIKPVDMAAHKALIDNFNLQMTGPNDRSSQIKSFIAQFDTLLTDTKGLMNNLDLLVNTVRYDKPVFYKTYFAARKPKKTATTIRAFMITVKDSVTNAPMYKAKLTMNAPSLKKEIFKQTNINGVIMFPTLTEDVYQCKVREVGYFDQDFTISILDGKAAVKNILLQADPTANQSLNVVAPD